MTMCLYKYLTNNKNLGPTKNKTFWYHGTIVTNSHARESEID
jgi:hypothetical protein